MTTGNKDFDRALERAASAIRAIQAGDLKAATRQVDAFERSLAHALRNAGINAPAVAWIEPAPNGERGGSKAKHEGRKLVRQRSDV